MAEGGQADPGYRATWEGGKEGKWGGFPSGKAITSPLLGEQ